MRKSAAPDELYANVHLYTAQMERKPVAVYVADERVGCGLIEEITEDSVKIEDGRYLRAVCTIMNLVERE